MSEKNRTFAAQNCKTKKTTTMSVLEQTQNMVTVRMSLRRWNRMKQLEETFRIAKAVIAGKKQCEVAPALSVSDAISYIDTL